MIDIFQEVYWGVRAISKSSLVFIYGPLWVSYYEVAIEEFKNAVLWLLSIAVIWLSLSYTIYRPHTTGYFRITDNTYLFLTGPVHLQSPLGMGDRDTDYYIIDLFFDISWYLLFSDLPRHFRILHYADDSRRNTSPEPRITSRRRPRQDDFRQKTIWCYYRHAPSPPPSLPRTHDTYPHAHGYPVLTADKPLMYLSTSTHF